MKSTIENQCQIEEHGEQISFEEQIHHELERSALYAPIARGEGCARGGGSHILYKELSYAIGGAVIEVHRHLGPGQVESTYERALAQELTARGIPHQRQVAIDSFYKGQRVGEFVADLVVDEQVILELKAVERVHPVHRAQLLSYLRATGMRLGMLINFNETVAWKGIHRIVC